jgi:hypothetical protein
MGKIGRVTFSRGLFHRRTELVRQLSADLRRPATPRLDAVREQLSYQALKLRVDRILRKKPPKRRGPELRWIAGDDGPYQVRCQ